MPSTRSMLYSIKLQHGKSLFIITPDITVFLTFFECRIRKTLRETCLKLFISNDHPLYLQHALDYIDCMILSVCEFMKMSSFTSKRIGKDVSSTRKIYIFENIKLDEKCAQKFQDSDFAICRPWLIS